MRARIRNQESTMQGAQVNNISQTLVAFHNTSQDIIILDNTLINLKFMSAQKISSIHHLSSNNQLEAQFYLPHDSSTY
jgi:hypothetical protein